MCYSAQVWSDYRKYVREFRAKLGIKEFFNIFFRRHQGAKLMIPRGIENAFANPQTDEERQIWDMVLEHRRLQSARFEEELFTQRARLVEAERKLQVKQTKTALESQRIATNKIERARQKIAEMHRIEHHPADGRIFPKSYVPVMVMQDGQLVIKPMRYQCRPARAPAFYDEKFPGTFNARRDSLREFWRGEFGHTHGLVVAQSFYEWVPTYKAEGRAMLPGEEESTTEIVFTPTNGQDMLIACLVSHWEREGEEPLDSFAFITDDPPQEVFDAGHDRCVVPLRPENVMAWLTPEGSSLDALDQLLEERERPYYEHQLLAA
ncbi:SOS response-associated peptidase family protein [Roseateles sp. P5_E4]